MNPRTARRIRTGLAAYGWVEIFRPYPTFAKVRKFHRGKLLSVAALMAFDRAAQKADVRATLSAAEELRISVEFAHIINHNFQETS